MVGAKPQEDDKGILNSVEDAGRWLAQRWENLETRYGRRTALTMALAMLATMPIPGNIAAVIAAAEAVRGIQGYASKNLYVRPSPFAYRIKDQESYFAECPRDDEGHCKPSGQGDDPAQPRPRQRRAGAKPKVVRGKMGEARREGKGKDAKVIMADGSKAPRHITASMIPPQWTNVQVSLDPKADLLVTARDAKGRVKMVYSDKFHMKTAAWKFAKTEEGLRKFDQISSQNQKNRKSRDPAVREAADCVWLLQEQGTRPGGESDTKGFARFYDRQFAVKGEVTEDKKGKKKSSVQLVFQTPEGEKAVAIRDIGAAEQIVARQQAGKGLEDARYWLQSFGATTLEPRHVVETDEGVRLQFMGKESVWHDHLIRDPELAKMLVERKKTANQRKGRLFDTDAEKLRKYTSTLDGGGFRPKDMRTMLANRMALREIKAAPECCPDLPSYKAAVKQVAEKVSGVLGNDPAMALKAYIDPAVFTPWRGNCQGCEED